MIAPRTVLQACLMSLLLAPASLAQSSNPDRPFAGTGNVKQIATLTNKKSGKIEQLDRTIILRDDVETDIEYEDVKKELIEVDCRLTTEQQEILDQLRLTGQTFTDECAFFAWLSEDTDAAQVQRVNEAVVAGEIQGVLPPIEAPKTPETPEIPNDVAGEVAGALDIPQTGQSAPQR